MREFNLEEALAGAPVCTRIGEAVTQLTHFTVTSECPLVGVIKGEFFRWMLDGSFPSSLDDSHIDLVMAPVKKTGWVARYAHDDGTTYINTTIFKDKATCVAICDDALSYHEISWEE